jgi:predicted DNA-binding transcriptional regulator AlpA
MKESPADNDGYLNSAQVRARYGNASSMWLHRRLHDDSRFPQPMRICGRRFWRLSDLIAWERARAANRAEVE